MRATGDHGDAGFIVGRPYDMTDVGEHLCVLPKNYQLGFSPRESHAVLTAVEESVFRL